MGKVLSQIEGKLGSQAYDNMVSYWCQKMECYVYIGQFLQKEDAEENKLGQKKSEGEEDVEMATKPEGPPVKNAKNAEEVASDILNFNLVTGVESEGGINTLNEGIHEIKLKFRPKAHAENTDTLIQGRA